MKRGAGHDGDGGDRTTKRSRGVAKPSSAPAFSEGHVGDDGNSNLLEVGTGTIVRYEEAKGYGFIMMDERTEDVFFLRSELPPEMANFHRREQIIDTKVEFEVIAMPDGKLRARRLALLEPGYGSRHDDGSRPRVARGRIVRFDRVKGYGFIQTPQESEDIFFLINVLSKDLQELCRRDNIVGAEVEVDVTSNEEGKPRASHVSPAARPHRDVSSRQLHIGSIVAFDLSKGFGFVKPDSIGEDVFFLRSEMPPELRDATNRDQVVGQRVEFEVRSVSDGKLRAHHLSLFVPPQTARDPRGAVAPSGNGSRTVFGRIRKFDRNKGYGFIELPGEPDVFFLPSALPKELQDTRDPMDGLEVSFDVFLNEDGKPRASRIQQVLPRVFGSLGPLPHPHPMFLGPAMPAMHMGVPMGLPMAPMVPTLGPHLGHPVGPVNHLGLPMGIGHGHRPGLPPPLGHMMVPQGVPQGVPPVGLDETRTHRGTVASYDPGKGFGFIVADGFSEDIFFPRPELPEELKQMQNKEQVIGKTVEFQIRLMPDGKLRARHLLLVAQHRGRREERGQASSASSASSVRRLGRIDKYDRTKGYGFIVCDIADNVFFLRSSLPQELVDAQEDLKDVEVTFELYANEEGKPRAKDLALPAKDHRPAGQEHLRVQPVEVHAGVIVRFDPHKGYGFVKPDKLGEDVFFLRSEMPPEISAAQRRDEVEHRRVEFEVRAMPDGKLRAFRLELLGERGSDREREDPEPALPELDEDLISQMVNFLVESGGGCDYGKFSSRFAKVKKKQLEPHFDIVSIDRGLQRIELPEAHPAREALPAEEPEAEAEAVTLEEEVVLDDPSIPLGPGCLPHGVIESYDPQQGVGSVRCAGFDEDIFFPRSALPEPFRGKTKLPDLVGVEACLELDARTDGVQRARRLDLLLKWHGGDRCWLLKRV